MEVAAVPFKGILNGSNIMKPNYHLNYGKKRIDRAIKNKKSFIPLGEAVKEVYTGGIFKRIFVDKEEFGLPYISAQHMMNSDPLEVAKTISKKYTPRIEDMTLKPKQILVSCAGTIGNVRLIGEDLDGVIGSQDIIRVISDNNKIPYGLVYAYLASPTAFNYMQSFIYGSVVPRIEPNTLAKLPVPNFSDPLQQEVHSLIVKSANIRLEAINILKQAKLEIKNKAKLEDLTTLDYEYFGNYYNERPVSTFSRNIKEISSTTINAFNYSKRVENLEERVRKGPYLTLSECLNEKQFFTSGSFRRLELDSPNSIKLINQSDIFQIKKKGKLLARIFIKVNNLVEYGEVMIAGVGTLGEGETFCRAIFCNEELENQLVSGEFIRMKTNAKVPSGYLYCWLSTDYGFRFIRKTQTGTKLCRPIQELLKEIPVPLLSHEVMEQIDNEVKRAHTMLYDALLLEEKAIDLVEKEIESWQEY